MAGDVIVVVGDDVKIGAIEKKHIDAKLREAVEDIAAYAAQIAQATVGRKTGNLAQNITSTQARKTATGWEASAGVRKTAPYAEYVEEGTGIFGPSGLPIRPKTGNVLVFKVGGKTVFARQVKGQPGQHYMQKAYLRTKEEYLPQRLERLTHEVGNIVG